MIFRSIFAILSFISVISCNPLDVFNEDSIMRLNTYTKAVELYTSTRRWQYTKQPLLLESISSIWLELNKNDNIGFHDYSLGEQSVIPVLTSLKELLTDPDLILKATEKEYIVVIKDSIGSIECDLNEYFTSIFEFFAQEPLFKCIHGLYSDCRIIKEFLFFFPFGEDFQLQENYLIYFFFETFFPKLLKALENSEFYEQALILQDNLNGFQLLASKRERLLKLLDFVYDIHAYTISKLCA